MPEQSLDEVRLLSVTEVAGILRVSKMTVYRHIEEGKLKAIEVGRSFRVYEESVRSILETPARRKRRPVKIALPGQPPTWVADAWRQGAEIGNIATTARLTVPQVRRILRDSGITL